MDIKSLVLVIKLKIAINFRSIIKQCMVLGLDSRRGLGIFLFTTVSRMALGLTQPHI
jgi:hypothetical protein